MAFTMDSSRFALARLHDKKVIFCGFHSSIAELYTNGWNIQVEEDLYRGGNMVALVNKELRLAGIIERHELYERMNAPLVIQRIMPADHLTIRTTSKIGPMFSLEPGFDMPIQDLTMRDYRMSDLLQINQPPELIVEPDEVQTLLDKIIALQRPRQKELRAEARKHTKKTQAQIISLVDWQAAA